MTDCLEEQANELEALESIYPDELQSMFFYVHCFFSLWRLLLHLTRSIMGGLSKFSAVVVCHNVEVPSAQKLTTIPVKKFTGTFDVRFVHNMHILY